ncbi:hypothetical protein IE53DRAFT_362696 [Violaceomyces palustris]|uniref:Uncharacterized protein n=1 Tax=Violaceomyces palustris TaxID=1673888 RepID=A0ACD0NW03_9BASI|nr:hypothetical protein IE53DRAFT_362696 [Violaceomyces palustris]
MSSALTDLCSPASKKHPTILNETPPSSPRTFKFPDGEKISIAISHLAPISSNSTASNALSGGDKQAPTHKVSISSFAKEGEVTGNDFEFLVTPPLAPFPSPASEPNDNTFAARSKRCGIVHHQSGSSSGIDGQLLAWKVAQVFLTLWPSQEYFTFHSTSDDHALISQLVRSGLALPHPAEGENQSPSSTATALVSRAAFWQGKGFFEKTGKPIWILPKAQAYDLPPPTDSSLQPTSLSELKLLRPQKPSVSSGPIYSRYVEELGQTLSYRIVSSSNEEDVDTITRWHATERVNEGWRQRLDKEEQRKTLIATEKDASAIGLIGEWDGEPWGYVEIYFAKESNIAPFYNSGLHDRGFHALVGEEKFRGPHRVRSWMGSLIHLMFLLDPNTELVLSEPRASNTKMVNYECMCGGHVEKLIDFSHKRAALVMFPRERFFQLCPLGPLPQHVANK